VSPGRRNAKAARASPEPKRKPGVGETLQITDGNDTDPSRSSMPELEYSSDDLSANSGAAMKGFADKSEVESIDSGEDSSEYDEEEEAELRNLLRKAMDIASERPEIFEEKKAFEKESNDNQFLKALGALRGIWRRLLIRWIRLLSCGLARPPYLLEPSTPNKSTWDASGPCFPRPIHGWARQGWYVSVPS
jgi:hypothetical protein